MQLSNLAMLAAALSLSVHNISEKVNLSDFRLSDKSD